MKFELVLLVLVAPAVYYWLVRAEQRGRPQTAFFLVVGLLLVELILFPYQNNVPSGIFHPIVAGQSFRLPELIIPLALLARLTARGAPHRFGVTAGALAFFLAWYGAGFLTGIVFGNSVDEAIFQAKALIYLGGGYALAVPLDPVRLLQQRWHRVVIVLGAIMAVLIVMDLTGAALGIPVPMAPGASIGRISPDSATVFVVLATLALLVESTRSRPRAIVCAACVPMIFSPLAATQRAAILGLVVAVLLIIAAMFTETWARRIKATATQAVVFAAVILVPFLIMVGIRAAWPGSAVPERNELPYSGVISDTFFATRKAQSADSRKLMWEKGVDYIRDYPVTGNGLGKGYNLPDRASYGRAIGTSFHNIGIDVLVRSGLVGLLLFLVALVCVLRDGLLAWFRHHDAAVAALAFGALVSIGGLLGKAMVESIFEKFRLATLFGLLLGVVASAAVSARKGPPIEIDEALETSVAAS